MKQILIGKQHDITAFASTDQSRYVLNGVHFNAEKKRLEATNGAILITIPVVESEEFPPVKGASEALPTSNIIPTAPFKRALANIPKRSSLPILENALLDSNAKITLTTTDLDTEQSVTAKPVEGKFPDVDKVVPDTTGWQAIQLSGEYLSIIADYAKKHSAGITFRIKDELSPVTFSIRTQSGLTAEGVLMPMRIT